MLPLVRLLQGKTGPGAAVSTASMLAVALERWHDVGSFAARGLSSAAPGGPSKEASSKEREAPLKPPEPPGPEDCCQSSCARCVWTQYYEALAEYQHATGQAAPTPASDPFLELEARLQREAEERQARNREG